MSQPNQTGDRLCAGHRSASGCVEFGDDCELSCGKLRYTQRPSARALRFKSRSTSPSSRPRSAQRIAGLAGQMSEELATHHVEQVTFPPLSLSIPNMSPARVMGPPFAMATTLSPGETLADRAQIFRPIVSAP